MTAPGDDRAGLEARIAATKDTQFAAGEMFATVTSPDGLVRAAIDSSGLLADLSFAPNAFERDTPQALAKSVLSLVRHGTLQVKQQIVDLMQEQPEPFEDPAADPIMRKDRASPPRSMPTPRPTTTRRRSPQPEAGDEPPADRVTSTLR